MNRLAILPLLLLFLTACAHAGVTPVPSPTGQMVAYLAPSDENATHIILLDGATGHARSIPIRWPWSARRLVWINDQLLVIGRNPYHYPGSFQDDTRLLNPATEKFTNASVIREFPFPPFAGTWNGKACIFSAGNKMDTTDIHALPDLSFVGALSFPAYGLSGGWMLRPVLPRNLAMTWTSAGWITPVGKNPQGETELRAVTFDALDLLDKDAKPVMRLTREQLKAAFGADLTGFTAALSPDRHALFVAPPSVPMALAAVGPGPLPHYFRGYAVFEVPTGKFLYSQRGKRTIVTSATLADDGLYAFASFPAASGANPARQQTFLIRQSASGVQKICEPPAPLGKSLATFVGPPSFASDKFLFIHLEKPDRTLYIVPVSSSTTTADIRTIHLPR